MGQMLSVITVYKVKHAENSQEHAHHSEYAEEVGHCMLPYIRDQILELVNETLLVAVL